MLDIYLEHPHKSWTADKLKSAWENNEILIRIDTGNGGNDDVLITDSVNRVEDVVQDFLVFHEKGSSEMSRDEMYETLSKLRYNVYYCRKRWQTEESLL